MNEIVYCGLKIYTECSYFRFREGPHASIVENSSEYALDVMYPKGITSLELSKLLKLEVIHDMTIVPTKSPGYLKIIPVDVTINGFKFRKLPYEPHTLRIAIVKDHPTKVAQDYNNTTIVVNEADRKDPNMLEMIFTNLKYLKAVTPKKFDYKSYELCNFPKITIFEKSLNLTSKNKYAHLLRSNHDIYLIKAVDYEHEFFRRVSKYVEDFGVQLTRVNREESLRTTSYLSYRISQTPVKYNHTRYSDVQEMIMCHTVAIDFSLRSPDMILFFDFKNRYSNLDLLTNMAEFKTQDKYGEEWTAAVKWGPITDEFNHTYEQDDNANFSHQCTFRAELFFYEVYDKNYSYIDEIITEVVNKGMWEEI